MEAVSDKDCGGSAAAWVGEGMANALGAMLGRPHDLEGVRPYVCQAISGARSGTFHGCGLRKRQFYGFLASTEQRCCSSVATGVRCSQANTGADI